MYNSSSFKIKSEIGSLIFVEEKDDKEKEEYAECPKNLIFFHDIITTLIKNSAEKAIHCIKHRI